MGIRKIRKLDDVVEKILSKIQNSSSSRCDLTHETFAQCNDKCCDKPLDNPTTISINLVERKQNPYGKGVNVPNMARASNRVI